MKFYFQITERVGEPWSLIFQSDLALETDGYKDNSTYSCLSTAIPFYAVVLGSVRQVSPWHIRILCAITEKGEDWPVAGTVVGCDVLGLHIF